MILTSFQAPLPLRDLGSYDIHDFFATLASCSFVTDMIFTSFWGVFAFFRFGFVGVPAVPLVFLSVLLPGSPLS